MLRIPVGLSQNYKKYTFKFIFFVVVVHIRMESEFYPEDGGGMFP